MITEKLHAGDFAVKRPGEIPSQIVPGLMVQQPVKDEYICPRCGCPNNLPDMVDVTCVQCELALLRNAATLIITSYDEETAA